MFTLQLQVATFEDLERIVACLKHSADPSVVAQVQAQVTGNAAPVPLAYYDAAATIDKPKNPRGRPRREIAAPLTESAAPASPEPAEAATAVQQPAVESAQQTYTLADVREALQGVVSRTPGDMRPATGLLEQFGAARVSEIKADDYAKFIAACRPAE